MTRDHAGAGTPAGESLGHPEVAPERMEDSTGEAPGGNRQDHPGEEPRRRRPVHAAPPMQDAD